MKRTVDHEALRNFLKVRQALDENRGALPGKTLAFVTLSRQYGAGGHSVAALLEHELNRASQAGSGWMTFDKELVKTVLEEHGLPQGAAPYIREERISEMRDMIEEMCGLHPPAFELVRKTSETLIHLASLGHVILVGLGGSIVTRGLRGGLHVRLVGSIERRTAQAAAFYGITLEEAEKQRIKEDQNRRDYARQNFDCSIDDPINYSLVINTDEVPFADAARLIADEVEALSARLRA